MEQEQALEIEGHLVLFFLVFWRKGDVENILRKVI